MSPEEIPFLCHGEKDYAKILWDDGEAVGFYSVKATGMQPQRYTTLSSVVAIVVEVYQYLSLVLLFWKRDLLFGVSFRQLIQSFFKQDLSAASDGLHLC